MQKMTITIPRTYNDGANVSESLIQRIELDLAMLYGGYSRISIAGAWTDESGETIYENSLRYEILTEYPSDYRKLKTYAKILCTILDQKCILTTCEDIQVDFIE